MSFALSFARSASNELSETRLAGLGLAAIALFLFTLAAFSPHVLGDGDTGSHLATESGSSLMRARRTPIRLAIRWRARRGLRMNGCRKFCCRSPFAPGGWNGVVLSTGAATALAALIVGLSAARTSRGGRSSRPSRSGFRS
jgi:hypothetical protein